MSTLYDLQHLEQFRAHRAIVWHSPDTESAVFSYNDVICATILVKQAIQEVTAFRGQTQTVGMFGILMSNVPVIIPAILGSLNSGHPFHCIDPFQAMDSIVTSLNRFNINYFVSNAEHALGYEFKCDKHLSIMDQTLFLYKRIICTHKFDEPIEHPDGIMFGICSSGTTGAPKRISVFTKCLFSNVRHLSILYELTSNDVIFVSAPPTFDPFVLDIFLSMHCGATIVLVAQAFRIPSPHLAEILFPVCSKNSSVTIIQMTPSLFKKFTNDSIRNKILASPKATLRILALGGEPFPTLGDILDWTGWSKNAKSMCRIMNIYGCTEMSCWSTIHEVKADDVIENKPVPLGMSIGGENKMILFDPDCGMPIVGDGIGELFLSSDSRYTLKHDSGKQDHTFRTGDLVQRMNGQYYYKSRCDGIVKRYGKKVDLMHIEEVARRFKNIRDACCVFDDETKEMFLFVCLASNESISVKSCLAAWLANELEANEMPNTIHLVDTIPLSNHGKVFKRDLMKCAPSPSQTNVSVSDYFVQRIHDLFDKLVDRESQNSFIEIGGSSFWALHMVSEIEMKYGTLFPYLVGMLLDDKNPLKNVLDYIKTHSDIKEHSNVDFSLVDRPNVVWWKDFGKCIDATPTVMQCGDDELVSIGSHSHLIRTIRTEDGKCVSVLSLPDRIESQFSQIGVSRFGVVGCYDGYLYCVDIITGSIEWTYDSGGMIKCQPLCLDTDRVIFGNYATEHNVWCLNTKTGSLEWKTKVGSKSIFANPLALNTPQHDIVVCTLDGTLAKLNSTNGQSIWTKSFTSPIFSSSLLLQPAQRFLVSEVVGKMYCFDFNGTEIWNFRTDGNLYSSPVHQLEASRIVFGCHDYHVYCLCSSDGSLMWRTKLYAPIFSRPLIMTNGEIVACSTNGMIATIEADTGNVCNLYRIDGDLYSSPVESVRHPGHVIVGCRNNHLYCLQLGNIV